MSEKTLPEYACTCSQNVKYLALKTLKTQTSITLMWIVDIEDCRQTCAKRIPQPRFTEPEQFCDLGKGYVKTHRQAKKDRHRLYHCTVLVNILVSVSNKYVFKI